MYSVSRMDLLSILGNEKAHVHDLKIQYHALGSRSQRCNSRSEIFSSYHSDERGGFDFLVCVFCVWEVWAGGGELPLYNALRASGPRRSWAPQTSPDPDALPAPAAWSSLETEGERNTTVSWVCSWNVSWHSWSGHLSLTFGFEKRRFLKSCALLL